MGSYCENENYTVRMRFRIQEFLVPSPVVNLLENMLFLKISFFFVAQFICVKMTSVVLKYQTQ